MDSWMALELIGLHDFVAQPSLRKVTKAFHSTPSGSETTAKKPAWGVKLSPSHPTRVKYIVEKDCSECCVELMDKDANGKRKRCAVSISGRTVCF